jgi:lipopolysaccharide export LptBFGC system permease protein LptF
VQEGGQLAVDDILANLKRKLEAPVRPVSTTDTGRMADKPAVKSARAKRSKALGAGKDIIKRTAQNAPYLPKQDITKPLNQYNNLAETFRPQDSYQLLKSAKTQAGVGKSIVETRITQTESRRKDWVKTGYELYIKYSFALVCFVFLFIGAPMGAIIRKGGFGYPILVSITFFVTFIFLTILCRKLAESFVMSPFFAAMMPCISLLPIGWFLTGKAMNDAQIFSTEKLQRWIFLIRQRAQRKSKIPTVG